ncbi:MAG: hypothetical protein LBP33_09260 [Candidatus Adiutrix sp.]|nr:hypothetical protein [Candidatus Adiutrix sp.]
MTRSKKKSQSLLIPTGTAVLGTLAALAVWPAETGEFLRPAHLAHKVGWPMLRAMFFMSLGLTAAMLIEALGWTERLGRLAAPLTRRARLPRVAGASFTTALVSNPAANALLSEALEKKEISPGVLAVANLLNGSWPSFIVHLPSTLVVAASLAGRAGLAYTGIMFSAATLRLLGAAALGRLLLPPNSETPAKAPPPERKKLAQIWPGLRRRLLWRLSTLLGVAIPVYYLITLAADLGFLSALEKYSAASLPDFFLPAEAAALIVFSLTAEFSSGFAAAGALIQNSTLTVAQAAAALIIGNIIATPVRVLRWQLAAFLGFFRLRLGLILIFCNQAFRVLSLILALLLFWRIFG